MSRLQFPSFLFPAESSMRASLKRQPSPRFALHHHLAGMANPTDQASSLPSSLPEREVTSTAHYSIETHYSFVHSPSRTRPRLSPASDPNQGCHREEVRPLGILEPAISSMTHTT